jgi:hypothetical protein
MDIKLIRQAAKDMGVGCLRFRTEPYEPPESALNKPPVILAQMRDEELYVWGKGVYRWMDKYWQVKNNRVAFYRKRLLREQNRIVSPVPLVTPRCPGVWAHYPDMYYFLTHADRKTPFVDEIVYKLTTSFGVPPEPVAERTVFTPMRHTNGRYTRIGHVKVKIDRLKDRKWYLCLGDLNRMFAGADTSDYAERVIGEGNIRNFYAPPERGKSRRVCKFAAIDGVDRLFESKRGWVLEEWVKTRDKLKSRNYREVVHEPD